MVSKYKSQQGVVLIVAIVFLAALTAVAAALMTSSTIDIKMAGATQEKVAATQEAFGANDEVIWQQINRTVNNTNHFALGIGNYPHAVATTSDINGANISLNNPNGLETDCPATKAASSVQVFKCNHLQVQIDKQYGRKVTSTKHSSEVQVRAGIAQQLLNVGK